ncbi:Heme O synthase, protoheme IX farnesyltransferase COX10-CtaB [hydrothermal vent metagenome]|uniref:Protoheme IX farnesyltransferase n=1 Tax=hydrothermal vent metagenome TaxID=652676 RepID=A0A3B0THH0_9ZZZZ
MLVAIRVTTSLLKLRIGVAIALSALAGMAATQGPGLTLAQVLAFALAVLGASSAAGAFNHYYERDLDRLMARTRTRPFASGLLKPGWIWPFSFLALLVASLVLAYAVAGGLATMFIFLGAFTYGVVYTVWLKRRSVWNIVVGGLAGSFALLAGAAAVDPLLQPAPIFLAIVMFLWTPPHFWSLAAAKSRDYTTADVPMLPLTASQRFWTLAILAHTAALAVLSLVPLAYGMGLIYGIGATAGGTFFLWRSWQLYRVPTRKTAMANFRASLVQLTLLIAAVPADKALRIVPWFV